MTDRMTLSRLRARRARLSREIEQLAKLAQTNPSVPASLDKTRIELLMNERAALDIQITELESRS